MTLEEIEQFIADNGKDIMRFCKMTAANSNQGDELYQETMLKLIEKRHKLEKSANIKSYALQIAINLDRNHKKKWSNRFRLVPTKSIDTLNAIGQDISDETTPETIVVRKSEEQLIRELLASMSDEYKLPMYLHYSADMQIKEIASILKLPEGTIKSRMHKAKQIIKEKLEEDLNER